MRNRKNVMTEYLLYLCVTLTVLYLMGIRATYTNAHKEDTCRVCNDKPTENAMSFECAECWETAIEDNPLKLRPTRLPRS